MSYNGAPGFSTTAAKVLWEAARSRAALTETFDPRELIDGPYETDRLEALAALGRECVEIVERTSTRWQLKPDTRQHVLGMLHHDGLLGAALAEFSTDDEFCQALADTLGGSLEIPKDATPQALGAIKLALEFAAPLVAVSEQQGELERIVASRVRDMTIQSLVPDGLLGRDGTLASLDRFASGNGPTMMVVSGVGGSGKSALLAEFVRRSRASANSQKVVWLDFDRATLTNVEPANLTIELARELALAFPEHRDALFNFRSEIERTYTSRRSVDELTFSGAATESSFVWSLWSNLRLSEILVGSSVLLILDAIEEVLVRDNGRTELLCQWLDQIQRVALPGIRTIVSGRAGSETESLALRLSAAPVEIGDIDADPASDLLARLLGDVARFVRQHDLNMLVKHYGGNPLTLTILGRFLRNTGPNAIGELLEDGGGLEFGQHYAQNVLYRRILHRIRSEDVDLVKLAYPGLILRKVTPRLIQEVLAEPCGLGVISLSRASELFEALKQQIWLIEAGGNDRSLVHRRDVRRMMFPAINHDISETAKEVHNAAANYHLRVRDPDLAAYDQSTESLYHRTFCGSLMSLDAEELMTLGTRIGSDIDDLPKTERTRLWHLQEGRRSEVQEQGFGMETRIAAQNIVQQRSRSATSTAVDWQSSSLRANHLFNHGMVEHVAELGHEVVAEFVNTLGLKRSASPTALIQTPVWQVAIATAGTSLGRELGESLARAIDRNSFDVEWSRPFGMNRRSTPTIADAIKALLSLFGVSRENYEYLGGGGRPPSGSVQRLEDLRILTLLQLDHPAGHPIRIAFRLLPHLAARFEDLLIGSVDELEEPDNHFHVQEWFRRLNATAQARRPSLIDLELSKSAVTWVVVRTLPLSLWPESHLLRGLLTDIHGPVQSVIEALPDRDLLQCVAALENSHKLWPRELTKQDLNRDLRFDRDRLLGTIVEIADRCGMLEKLVIIAAKVSQSTHALAVKDMMNRYTKCLGSGLPPHLPKTRSR